MKNAEVSDAFVRQFEKLLVGGIWCIVTPGTTSSEENQRGSPFTVTDQAHPDAQHGHGRPEGRRPSPSSNGSMR